jgi:hypothetical protein
MADEEVGEGGSEQEGPDSVAGGLVPENVPTGMRAAVGKIALNVLLKGFEKIIDALFENVKTAKHLPSLKLLIDLAMLVTEAEDVRQVDYVGFAVQLKMTLEKMQGEVLEGVVMPPARAVIAEGSDSGVVA